MTSELREEINTKIQIAAFRILQAITIRKQARYAMYISAGLAIASTAGASLPEALSAVATLLGAEALGYILGDLATGKGLSDEEIVRRVEEAVPPGSIDELLLDQQDLIKQVTRLASWQRQIKYIIEQDREMAMGLLKMYEVLSADVSAIRLALQTVASQEQSEEIKAMIQQIIDLLADEQRTGRYDRALQDYLAALKVFCISAPYLTLKELLGSPVRPLDEIYVPLQAKEGGVDEGGKPLSIREALLLTSSDRQKNHVLLSGKPGAGKTTVLKQVARSAWANPGEVGLNQPHLPIIVRLQSLALVRGITVGERLINALKRDGEILLIEELPNDFFNVWPARTGAPWLLLLDGFDEIPEDSRLELDEQLVHLLSEQRADFNYKMIITTRPTGKPSSSLKHYMNLFELLPLNPKQQKIFARKWFGNQAKSFLRETARASISELASNPLLLTIQAIIYSRSPDKKLPRRTVDLYESMVKIWLSEARRRSMREELGKSLNTVVRSCLKRFAIETTVNPSRATVEELREDAQEHIRKELRMAPALAAHDGKVLVEVLGRRSGLFQCRQGTCSWDHPTFREFLVAQKLADDIKDCVYNELGRFLWPSEVSRFLRDSLTRNNANQIIGILLSEDTSQDCKLQAMLLIGQLKIQEARPILLGLLEKTDQTLAMIREIYISFALLGDEEAALEYVSLCKSDPEHAERNKSYTEYYFSGLENPTEAIIRHLKEGQIKGDYYYERRILDVYTAKQVADERVLPYLVRLANNPREDKRVIEEAKAAIHAVQSRQLAAGNGPSLK